jgi:hypothetical protein
MGSISLSPNALWIKICTGSVLNTMSELFGDLQGVIMYFDGFLVTGESMEEL